MVDGTGVRGIWIKASEICGERSHNDSRSSETCLQGVALAQCMNSSWHMGGENVGNLMPMEGGVFGRLGLFAAFVTC